MINNKQSKIITIVVLCIAVVGITLGFAAFSNTLTISSNATVSPNSSDFKMTIYGMSSLSALEKGIDNIYEVETYDSLTTTVPYIEISNQTITDSTPAIINNEAHTISNISATFTKPDNTNSITYMFMIKNDGKYSAYIKETDFKAMENKLSTKTCVSKTDINKDLVTEACDGIRLSIIGESRQKFLSSNSNFGTHEILPNDYIFLFISMYYTGDVIADQEFSVEFPELTLNFSTTV